MEMFLSVSVSRLRLGVGGCSQCCRVFVGQPLQTTFFGSVHSLAPPQVITAAIFQTKDLHRHFICNSSSVTPRIRVNKALGERFSRRQADELVRAGRVTVNGKLVAPGARVTVTDVIAVDGEQLRLSPRLFVSLKDLGSKESHFVYFKYWKPVGVECTTARDCPDNILDVSGLGEWAEKNQRRLFNVGRLDKDSTGIILLTDDGRLANALLGKNSGLAKSYLVAVNKPVTDDVVDALEQGFLIETEYRHDKKVKKIRSPTLPCAVRLGKNSFEIEMDIYEGRNRQIRRMLESLGYQVQRLHRYSFCSIELGPELQEEGTWAPLNSKELVVIHQALQKLANKESH